jgi:hypothetical protein
LSISSNSTPVSINVLYDIGTKEELFHLEFVRVEREEIRGITQRFAHPIGFACTTQFERAQQGWLYDCLARFG